MKSRMLMVFWGLLSFVPFMLEAQSGSEPVLIPSLVSLPGTPGTSIEIRWLADEDNEYEVQARGALSEPWTAVISGLKSEGEEVLLYREPALDSARFFRLLEAPLDPTTPPGLSPDFHAGRIMPARANLTPGQSIRFHAAFEDGGPVDWFVTPNINDIHGIIADSGVYTSPSVVPDPPFIFIVAVNRNNPDQRAAASILMTSSESHQITRDQAVEILVSEVIETLDNKEDIIAFGPQEPLTSLDRVLPYDPDPNATQVRLSESCWFFMVDEAPFSNWTHPALFVAINCRTGEIQSSERQNWYPLINGEPVYYRSTDRFDSSDRVYIGASAWTVVQHDADYAANNAFRPLNDIADEDIPPIPRMFPAFQSACECPDGPRKHALIGVMSPEEPRLVQSGRDMKKVLESPTGGRFDTVTLFSDSGTDLFKKEIEQLRPVVRPCDVVLVMLLGHGGSGGVGGAQPGDVFGAMEHVATTSRYLIVEACDAEPLITSFENSRFPAPQTTIFTASGTAQRFLGTDRLYPLIGQSPLHTTISGIDASDRSGFTDALLSCFSRYDTLEEVHECLTSVTDIGPFALRIAASGPILKTVLSDDSDLDGIVDHLEEQRGFDPNNPDSDGDGVCDGIEYNKLSLAQVKLDTLPEELFSVEERGRLMDITSPNILPEGVALVPYEYQFTLLGGISHNEDLPSVDNPFGYGPMTGWTLVEGSVLPEGLALSRENGRITGTPIEPGLYEFNIQYMDAIGTRRIELFQLEIRHPGTDGARILVTTGEDGNVRDDDISLREAVMIMTGQLSLTELRADPDPNDRLPVGELRFVTGGLPGRDSKDLVEWSSRVFAEGIHLDGPVIIDADDDRIFMTNTAVHVAEGPAFEISGNNNHLENTVDIIAASGPALIISGNGNMIASGSSKTSSTFSEIEGAGQPDPAIIITGHGNSLLGSSVSGFGTGVLLKEEASNNRLSVVRCISNGLGIHLTDRSNHNRLEDCLVGFQFDRARNHVVAPNQSDGVLIDGGAFQNNLVGCWIGANGGAGVRISDESTYGNRLEDVDIGSLQGKGSRAGEVGPNEGGGLIIEAGARGNSVDGGIYSNNTGHGIWVRGVQTFGNRLGSGESDALIIKKSDPGNGIHVSDGANRNSFAFEVELCGGHAIAMVGQGTEENRVTHRILKSSTGRDLTFRTEIENTQSDAIFIGQGAQRNIIQDTRIRRCPTGIKIDGEGVRGNQILDVSISQCTTDGIILSGGATENMIGPDVTSDANGGSGVVISGTTTRNNFIENNTSLIFTKNTRYAIEIIEGSSGNVVANNRVNQHSLGGVRIDGASTEGNLVKGNTFRGAVFAADVPGTGFGVVLSGGASRNHIRNNTCSNNGQAGIMIQDAVTRENLVDGNLLSSNLGPGVWINNATFNLIGLTSGAGNVINGNAIAGVHISGDEAEGNRVQRNFIGSAFSPNLRHGVMLSDGASSNIIGGARVITREVDTPLLLQRPKVSHRGSGNVISGNGGDGIHISDAHANKVLGNLIGFLDNQPDESINLGHGVFIGAGASNNCVGNCPAYPARDWGFGNYIISNAQHGIEISGQKTQANQLQGNWIFEQGEERIHMSEGANNGAQVPRFNLDPVMGVVSGVAPTAGFVEVFSDLDQDQAIYHFTAFVGEGEFVIRQLDPVASVNATMVASERPLRINSVQLIQFTPSDTGNSTAYQIVAP